MLEGLKRIKRKGLERIKRKGLERVEYPEVQRGNFGFCDLCIKTATKGKYEITVYVDRASIKAGKMDAINDALRKMQGAIKLVSGKRPVIHLVIVVEEEEFLSDLDKRPRALKPILNSRIKKYVHYGEKIEGENYFSNKDYDDFASLAKLQKRSDLIGIACFFVHKKLTDPLAVWGHSSKDSQSMIVSTIYPPEEIKFTAVHEFGHIMGLAGNHGGMFTNEGEARGGHCTVPKCTMRDVVGTTMKDGILNINNSKEGLTRSISWKNLKEDSGFRLVRNKFRLVRKKVFRLVRKKKK